MGQISFDPLPFEISHHSQMFKQLSKGTNKFLSVCQKTTFFDIEVHTPSCVYVMRNVEMKKIAIIISKNYYLSSNLIEFSAKNLFHSSIKRFFLSKTTYSAKISL